jgi:predicted nucleic acid-binding protein
MIELLVRPLRLNENDLVKQYIDILCNSKTLEIVDVNIEISKKASWFRAKYGFKTPDAIQLATSIWSSADYFLTNDLRFKSIKEIKVLVLEDFIPG